MPPRGVEQERQRDLGRETVSTPAGDRTVNTNDRYTGGSTGGAREGFGGGTRELRDRVERDREARQVEIGRDIARAREARGDGGGGLASLPSASGRDRPAPRSIPGGATGNRNISPLSFGAGISNPSAGQALALGMGRIDPVALTGGIGGITGPMVDRLQAFRRAGAAAGFNYPVVSGFRTPEQQADIIARNMPKYGFSQDDVAQWRADVQRIGPVAAGDLWEANERLPGGHALRANIALPGRSMHQQNKAADLGGDIYSPEGAKWAHTNAADYGLSFRLSEADAARAVAAGRQAPPYHERHEVWHVEYDPNGNPVAVSDTGRVENIENMVVANVGGEERLLDMGQAAQMQQEWQEVSIGTRGLGGLQDRGLSFGATGTPVASGTPTTQALDAVETAATTAGTTAPGPLGAGQRMPADTAPRTALTQPAAPGLLGRVLPQTTNPRLQNPRPTAEQWAAMSPEDQQRWAAHEMWRSGNRGPLSSGIGIMGLAGNVMGEPSQTGFFDPTTGQYYENPEYGGMSFKGLTSTDPANVARNRLGAIANTPSPDVDREGPEDRRVQNEAPPIEDEIAVDPNAWNMDDQLAYYDQRAAAAMGGGAVPAAGTGGIDTIGNYQNPYIQAMMNRPVYPYTTPWWMTRNV